MELRRTGLLVVVVVVGLVALLVAVAWVEGVRPPREEEEAASPSCVGPPYLYITFHGGQGKHDVNDVLRYTRDGCDLGSIFENDSGLDELRGMVLLDSGAKLLVSNSNQDNTAVKVFGACDASQSDQRPYLGDLVTTSTTPALLHPYALLVGGPDNETLWVANQDTSIISWFNVSTGTPLAESSWLSSNGGAQLPLGSFSYLGAEAANNGTSYRGMALVPASTPGGNPLLLAANDIDAVLVYDSVTGEPQESFEVDSPIAVIYDPERGNVLIGSNPNHAGNDAVYVYHFETRQLVMTLTDPNLDHPAGMAIDGSILYVLSQNNQAFLAFDLANGDSLGVITSKLPDQPEQIILSDC